MAPGSLRDKRLMVAVFVMPMAGVAIMIRVPMRVPMRWFCIIPMTDVVNFVAHPLDEWYVRNFTTPVKPTD